MFLLVSTVLAGAVGLDSLPAEPSNTRPTVTPKERMAQIQRGEITPDVLVPVGASAGKKNWLERYYDEDGNIYTQPEVLLIVGSTTCCDEDIAKHKTHSIMTSAFVYSSLVPIIASIWQPACVCGAFVLLVPGTIFMVKENKDMDRILTQYNQRQ